MQVYDYEDLPPGWEGPFAPPQVDPNIVQIPPLPPEARTKGTKRFRPQNSTQGTSTQVKARKLEDQSHAPAIVTQHTLAKQGDLQMPMDMLRVAIRRRHTSVPGDEGHNDREPGNCSSHASDSEVEHQLFLTETSQDDVLQPAYQTLQPLQTSLTLSELHPGHQSGTKAKTLLNPSPEKGGRAKIVRFDTAESSTEHPQAWPSSSMVRVDPRSNQLSQVTALSNRQHYPQPIVGIPNNANPPSVIENRKSGVGETLHAGGTDQGGSAEVRVDGEGLQAQTRTQGQGMFAPHVPSTIPYKTPAQFNAHQQSPPYTPYIPPAALPNYPPFHLASYGYQLTYPTAYQQPQVPHYAYPAQHPYSGPWNGPWNGQGPSHELPMPPPGMVVQNYAGINAETGHQGVAQNVAYGAATQPGLFVAQGQQEHYYQRGEERIVPMDVEVDAGQEAEMTSEAKAKARLESEDRVPAEVATPTETESESEGYFDPRSDVTTEMETETETETETEPYAEAGAGAQIEVQVGQEKEQEENRQVQSRQKHKRDWKHGQAQDMDCGLEQGPKQEVTDRVRKDERSGRENAAAGPSRRRQAPNDTIEEEHVSSDPPSPTSAQRTQRRAEKSRLDVHGVAESHTPPGSPGPQTKTFQMRLLEQLSALPSINQHLEDLKTRADASEDMQEELLSILDKVDRRVTSLEQTHNAWTPLTRKRHAERERRRMTLETLRNLHEPTPGTDADDEEDAGDQGEAPRRRRQRNGDPGISRSAKNLVVSELRKHVKSMLKVQHLRELPRKFPPLTQEEIEAYETKHEGAPQTSALHLRIDFESPWKNFAFNEDARGVIVADFNKVLQEGRLPNLAPYLDVITLEVIGVLLDTYVVYLRDQYRLYTNQDHREMKEERNRKARIAGRRMTLYLSRVRAASVRPHLKHISDILMKMDATNMSEDERIEPMHSSMYQCFYAEWQSDQLRTCFEALDELYREDYGAGNKAGNPPRTRHPNEEGSTVSTPAPKGLPRKCYNEAWLATLSDYRLQQYNIQDVDIDLSITD